MASRRPLDPVAALPAEPPRAGIAPVAVPTAARAPRRPRRRLPRGVSAWLGLRWRERAAWLGRKLAELARGGGRIQSPDRVLLEGRLLPAFAADPTLRSLLFVGCGPYTRHYAALFEPASARFRTLDIDPRRARFGHAGHIVAALQDVGRHLAPASVDAVVCNGVYGFGLDERDELDAALRASWTVLRPGGAFVLGWNDVPAFAPFDPAEVALGAGFARDEALLGAWRTVTATPTRHTFDSYVRPAAAA
jgi:SAM-dependent methyltransferase